VQKIQVSLKYDKITSTLREDLFKFMMLPRWSLLRKRRISDNTCRENQSTHFVFKNLFSKVVPFM